MHFIIETSVGKAEPRLETLPVLLRGAGNERQHYDRCGGDIIDALDEG